MKRPASRGGARAARLLVLLSASAAVAAALLASNLWLPPAPLSANDLHLLWLLDGRDYFVEAGSGRRALNPELVMLDNAEVSFPAAKERGALRVFCVGGSTTQGWPFHHRLSYPLLLSLLTRDALPGRRVEVVNAGLSGSDSTSDVGLVRELLDFQPDLLILYEGRNDPPDLVLHSGWRSAVLRAYAWLLRRSRLYAWLRSRLSKEEEFDHAHWARAWLASSRRVLQPTLEHRFVENMRAMIGSARSRGCRVMLLTQVVSAEEDAENPGINVINGSIRALAKEQGAILVDLDAEFRRRAARADALVIPYPVTHPDLAGYELMARLAARGLGDGGWPQGSRWRWEDVRSDAEYARALRADEPAYLAEVYGRLSAMFDKIGKPELAARYSTRAGLANARAAR